MPQSGIMQALYATQVGLDFFKQILVQGRGGISIGTGISMGIGIGCGCGSGIRNGMGIDIGISIGVGISKKNKR